MKKISMIATLQVLACAAFSQSTFSILSYSAPEGWYAKQNGENSVLVKKGAETTNCKIVFFKPVNVAVNSVATYTKYRNDLLGTSASKTKSWTTVQKESDPGWFSFSSLQHTDANSIPDIAFYSISNSIETVFVAAYSDNNGLCSDELDSIINSINLIGLNNQQGDKTKKAKQQSKKVRIAALKSLKGMVN
jgi:hypothetical protein